MNTEKMRNACGDLYTFLGSFYFQLVCTFLLRPDCLVFQPDDLPVVCDNLVSN